MKEETGWWICFWLALIYFRMLIGLPGGGVTVQLADGMKCNMVEQSK
jgi:hypothetical protein